MISAIFRGLAVGLLAPVMIVSAAVAVGAFSVFLGGAVLLRWVHDDV